jgi:hypothetical protein
VAELGKSQAQTIQQVPYTEYPPSGGWTCQNCGKYHANAHWKDSRQLSGQSKWDNWESRDSGACLPSDAKYEFDEDGMPRPLFCPHCGHEDQPVFMFAVGKKRRRL